MGYNGAMGGSKQDIDDREREKRRLRFNNRVSQCCVIVALVIGVVDLAITVLGMQDPRVVMLGLTLSVILLAIAMLQDHSNR